MRRVDQFAAKEKPAAPTDQVHQSRGPSLARASRRPTTRRSGHLLVLLAPVRPAGGGRFLLEHLEICEQRPDLVARPDERRAEPLQEPLSLGRVHRLGESQDHAPQLVG